MNIDHELLQKALPGITLSHTLAALGIALATIFLRRTIVQWAVRGVEKAMIKAGGEWDEDLAATVRTPINAIILIYGAILALQVLPLPSKPLDLAGKVDSADRLAILVLGIWLLTRLIAVADKVIRKKAVDPEHWLDAGLAPFITIFLNILVITTGAVMVAQNMGYSVSALVASLGLGAAALALASQDTLTNIFGSLMIMMDKPFAVGDWVKGADFEGTVEEIGLRSTRIRTFEKTVLIVPNSHIVNVIVENMDRRKDREINARRVFMKLGVAMTASADDLERAIGQIKTVLMDEPLVEKKFEPLVFFTDFAESSYDLTVIYFANSERVEWLRTRQ
ncbi:MAG: mechanosensitive ion channel family protein, partial [Nitrospinota bacterium]|nr:mechanosensitive ion channel family protein [Nitrospinota bacterium]